MVNCPFLPCCGAGSNHLCPETLPNSGRNELYLGNKPNLEIWLILLLHSTGPKKIMNCIFANTVIGLSYAIVIGTQI